MEKCTYVAASRIRAKSLMGQVTRNEVRSKSASQKLVSVPTRNHIKGGAY
jgi:hypothetical protein